VAAGCSNKVAANQLNITEETVKDHMKSILSAFALQNETDAQISVAVTGEA
jgi:DNA-binding NarL/FixJ family response regulator